jgi:chromosome segregation ATPase
VKAELKTDIHEVKGEVHKVKGEVHEVKAEVHKVKAGMHAMQAQMARIELLVEEQNARNKIVLDGITALLSRQDQIEQRVTHVEATVRHLASPPRAPEST